MNSDLVRQLYAADDGLEPFRRAQRFLGPRFMGCHQRVQEAERAVLSYLRAQRPKGSTQDARSDGDHIISVDGVEIGRARLSPICGRIAGSFTESR